VKVPVAMVGAARTSSEAARDDSSRGLPRSAVALAVWFAVGGAPGCASAADDRGERQEPADSTSAPATDGGASALGDPIEVAPTEEWVWVPIEGTVCADGTEAGIGVNFTTESRDLVIFFQGNGVCYDAATCSIFQSLLTGMGPDPLDHLWWGDENTGRLGIFDRTNPDNPLRRSNFIAFPHCGVDGHTADQDSTYPPLPTIHQHGYANVTVALRRIVPTFLDASRIVVAGFSAGGIGAGANYHQIATAFEAVGKPPPYLIDDAGPVLRPPYLGPLAQSALRTGWGLDKTLEPWCPECATSGYHAIHETLARLHPGLRASVVCAYNDGVATPLYGLLNGDGTFDGSKLEAGIRDLSAWSASFQAEVSPSVQREFLYPGPRHGALVVAPLGATPGLSEFLTAQLEDNPDWATVQ
jgi:hypothetical protein